MQAKSILPSSKAPPSSAATTEAKRSSAAEDEASRDVAYTVQWLVDSCGVHGSGDQTALQAPPQTALALLERHGCLQGADAVCVIVLQLIMS